MPPKTDALDRDSHVSKRTDRPAGTEAARLIEALEAEPERTAISLLLLLVGLLLAAVAVYSFGRLSAEVRQGAAFVFDRQVMDFLRQLSSPGLTTLFQVITHSASSLAIGALALALAVTWWRAGRRADAVLVMITVAGSTGLGQWGKHYFSRPRPQFFPWLTGAGGWSFPSGHTLAALSLGGLLAGLQARGRHGRWQLAWWTGAGVWVVLVGVSRVYLGVHYPSDVLASLSVGTLYLLVTFLLYWFLIGRRPVHSR